MKNIPKRSGDHYLHPVDNLPEGLEEVKHKGRFVFGVGEASNHNHTITATKPKDFKIFKDKNGRYYFQVLTDDVQISHFEGDSNKVADHKTIPAKKGIYKQVHEREIDLFSQCVRKVLD